MFGAFSKALNPKTLNPPYSPQCSLLLAQRLRGNVVEVFEGLGFRVCWLTLRLYLPKQCILRRQSSPYIGNMGLCMYYIGICVHRPHRLMLRQVLVALQASCALLPPQTTDKPTNTINHPVQEHPCAANTSPQQLHEVSQDYTTETLSVETTRNTSKKQLLQT